MKTSRYALAFLFVLGLAAPAAAAEPLVQKVKDSIERAKRFLAEQENDKGNFEQGGGLHPELLKARTGGPTALAVVALLNAGVPADDPLMQRCLKYLRKLQPKDAYTYGLQTMAFCLAGYKQDRVLVQRNLDWIARVHMPGGWPYEAGDEMRRYGPDDSINQYVLLGLHEARLAGFAIDKRLVSAMRRHYNSNSSGQWTYRRTARSRLTMTTAGLCNLLITSEDVGAKRRLEKDGVDPQCGKYDEDPVVQAALGYLGGAFPNDVQASRDRRQFPNGFYCLYGIERAGRLTGQRFLFDSNRGGKDWYRIGCEYLVATQLQNGSWEGRLDDLDRWPVVATSFALLFLSKGRTPVLISKLAHGAHKSPDEIEKDHLGEAWNRKRNDVRNVVEYVSREYFEEQLKEAKIRPPLAWQVFDPRNKDRKGADLAAELLQSPILYINGHTLTRVLGTETEEMLKEYINNGGFIFAEACCNSKDFDGEFRKLIKAVTGSDLAPLGRIHPVWEAAGNKFHVSADDRLKYPLEGIQQGCKTVVVYSPRALAGDWENNDTKSPEGKAAFHIAANVIAYATGGELPVPRLSTIELVRESKAPKPPPGYFQVAQLVFSKKGMPLAPKAMPTLMAEVARHRLDVNHQTVKLTLAEDRLLAYKFFYLHDRVGFRVPSGDDLKNLRFTLEHGGLLFADAACGSKAFDKSFRALVEALWPKEKHPLVPIELKPNQAANELYSSEVNGKVIQSVKYRREEKDGSPSKDFQEGPPRLEGVKINGRWVVIYSRYDIGCALEKHQSTNCLGHDYDSAVKLAKAVVLYALRR